MKPIGIYIHIPFCDGKCNYCDFYNFRADEAEFDRYTSAVCSAVKMWAQKIKRPVDTVYFGGGTPSLLGAERLAAIYHEIKNCFDVSQKAEVTVEVNPTRGGFDFEAARKAGFNRVSIGLQSSNDKELRTLGRRHAADDAKNAVLSARAAGFSNISLDVMLAIPYQSERSLDETIRFCATCDVQHISAYILKVEENTPFFQMKERLPLFDENAQSEMYRHAVKTLDDCGYHQYEISNFCKNGFESRHNLRYWHDEEYLGIGPSAHSFIDGERFFFPNAIERFYRGDTEFESTGGDEEEYIMLSLRLKEGLIYRDFEKRFHHPLPDRIKKRASALFSEDFLTIDDSHISLTVKGFLVSNAVIAYLLNT